MAVNFGPDFQNLCGTLAVYGDKSTKLPREVTKRSVL